MGGGRLPEREGAQTPKLRPRVAQTTHSALCSAAPEGCASGKGDAGEGLTPSPQPWRGGAHTLGPQSPTQASPPPREVTPTSRAVWGWGSCRSLTLRRLILMAWRRRGGRRWEWERSVAMVAALPFPSACPRWVKIAKPQDYAKSPGLPPCAGERGGGWWGGQVGLSSPQRSLHLLPSRWPGQDPGRNSPRLEAEGGLGGRVWPHPTLPQRP